MKILLLSILATFSLAVLADATSDERERGMIQGLDSSFDAAIFLGYKFITL